MSQLTRPEATIAGPGSAKTVYELLAQARGMLPHRPSPDEALRAQASGALLVDIRGDDQRRDGLIPGALVIPRNCLEWRCDPTSQWRHPFITRRDLRIILVCHEGYQSSLAAATLQQLGLIHATDLDGGFTAWAAAGLPVIAPSEVPRGFRTVHPLGWISGRIINGTYCKYQQVRDHGPKAKPETPYGLRTCFEATVPREGKLPLVAGSAGYYSYATRTRQKDPLICAAAGFTVLIRWSAEIQSFGCGCAVEVFGLAAAFRYQYRGIERGMHVPRIWLAGLVTSAREVRGRPWPAGSWRASCGVAASLGCRPGGRRAR